MMSPEPDHAASESTPLLAGQDDRSLRYGESQPAETTAYHDEDHDEEPPDASPTKESKPERGVRWPTVIALAILCLVVIVILVFAFIFPSVVKEYAQEAAVVEPVAISIASFTPAGVRTRIQGTFVLDSGRVKSQHVSNLGRFATWIAKEVETDESEARVYLPEYGDVLVGTVAMPPIKVNIRDGYVNNLDFFADLNVGDIEGIRAVGNDWLGKRLEQVWVRGTASVSLKSGILNLGVQDISESFVLQDQNLPSIPEYNITKLNIHNVTNPGSHRSPVVADVSVSIQNDHAVNMTVPSLEFQIFVPNCNPNQTNILVANATTEAIKIQPQSPVVVQASGSLHEFPDELTNICPGREASPLGLLVQKFIQGTETTIYVSGGDRNSSNKPEWLGDILRNLTVPVPLTSHGFGHLVKRFSMTNVAFSLPEPFAEPGTPESKPKVSSLVKVAIGLPPQMNFPVNVSRVRALADVYYKGEELGQLDLRKWQDARTARNLTAPASAPELLVEFDMDKAPLDVTNEDAFADVVQHIIFNREAVPLEVHADVDAETDTPMGQFTLQDIPASGQIHVKPPNRSGGGFADLKPRIESVRIAQTTKTSVEVLTKINFTNPTDYSAHVPFVKLRLAHNDTDVAHLIARNVSISAGANSTVEVEALWNPMKKGGEKGLIAGRDLLSRYVSGANTTVTIRSDAGTIPALPSLGEKLSHFDLKLQIPRLRLPGDDDDDGDSPEEDHPHFIKEATVHIFSSTAIFTLISPLPSSTLYITSINATAFYEHDKPVGRIQHDIPFAVPPGSSETPRLPVDLDLGGAGYDALKKALGGTLKLDTAAEVRAKLGDYAEVLAFEGRQIGTKVRP